MRSNVWLPYTLAVEIETELRMNAADNVAFSFTSEDYCNVVQSIAAAGMSSDPEVAANEMEATAAFFKTLTKDVLLRRCIKITALYDVLKKIRTRP
jgi:hypothetical protein